MKAILEPVRTSGHDRDDPLFFSMARLLKRGSLMDDLAECQYIRDVFIGCCRFDPLGTDAAQAPMPNSAEKSDDLLNDSIIRDALLLT